MVINGELVVDPAACGPLPFGSMPYIVVYASVCDVPDSVPFIYVYK
jgi:hypothetical protein